MAEIVLEPEVIEIPEPDISHLVTEDDEPVENIFSEKQQRILTESLYTSWPGPPGEKRSFIGLANVGMIYSVNAPAIVPDVLISLDVELPDELWAKKHRSYFIWEYGKPPEVVIEIVSNRRGGEASTKMRQYARLGVTYYVIFDPLQQLSNKTLRVYELQRTAYIERNDTWLPGVELGLTLWEGEYENYVDVWLRWCDREGNLLLTGAEAAEQERQRAEQERQRAEQERQRAEQERQRAERLAAQLRVLGVEPGE
jgi:Uma2 family endonuclease